MDNKSGSLVCTATCWGIALLGGFLAAALLMVLAGWSFLQAVFIGVVLFVIAGALLSWLLCKPLPAPNTAAITPGTPGAHPAKTAPAKAAPAKSASAAAPAAAAPAAAAPKTEVKSSQLPGQDDLAGRKGAWKYDSGSGAGGAAASGAPATAAAPAASESQPETLSGARGGVPDDLKLLKGVGPKLEGTLNELGFYHFDQIAKWTGAEVAWVDSRLKFKGRIERDGWIEQAKILAAGGETEFSKRSKK